MPDICHIEMDWDYCLTHNKPTGVSWCGTSVKSKWNFVTVDHALYNRLNVGRLLVCQACWDAILHVIESDKEASNARSL